ncbi:uncharacterized protein LOC122267554 [Penaeus japonicus]|uniref:uncharacterized protein LOC122267554 n=1 Tax=Penaeus japonicus TaxID=27405 RepID=UPI001C70E393|nr:uncharacterized protein LOC122267554 [Penaeus japonicus]
MAQGMMVGGVYITKKVSLYLIGGALLFVIAGGVCLGIAGNMQCYDYYCEGQTTGLMMSGIISLVTAGIILISAVSMLCCIKHSQDSSVTHAHHRRHLSQWSRLSTCLHPTWLSTSLSNCIYLTRISTSLSNCFHPTRLSTSLCKCIHPTRYSTSLCKCIHPAR